MQLHWLQKRCLLQGCINHVQPLYGTDFRYVGESWLSTVQSTQNSMKCNARACKSQSAFQKMPELKQRTACHNPVSNLTQSCMGLSAVPEECYLPAGCTGHLYKCTVPWRQCAGQRLKNIFMKMTCPLHRIRLFKIQHAVLQVAPGQVGVNVGWDVMQLHQHNGSRGQSLLKRKGLWLASYGWVILPLAGNNGMCKAFEYTGPCGRHVSALTCADLHWFCMRVRIFVAIYIDFRSSSFK